MSYGGAVVSYFPQLPLLFLNDHLVIHHALLKAPNQCWGESHKRLFRWRVIEDLMFFPTQRSCWWIFFCLTCRHCMVHIDNVQHNTLQFGKEKATATYGVLPAANVPPPYALASISAVQFDHYGHRFATAALDGTVCTWQLEVGGRSNIHPTESCLCLNGHASYVYRSFYFARLHWSHTGFLGTVEGV